MSFIFAVNLHPCYNQQDIPLSHSSYTGLHLAQFSQVHFGMYNNKYGSPPTIKVQGIMKRFRNSQNVKLKHLD